MKSELYKKLNNSIFISGMHRSGTSWVANILAAGGQYLIKDEEIFLPNYLYKGTPIQIWNEYINSENEHKYLDFIYDVLSNKYSFIESIIKTSKLKDSLKVFQHKGLSIKRRLFNKSNPLIIVEPLGLLSSEWFEKSFNCQMVIIIRHPAAIISSLKRRHIKYRFSSKDSLLTQNSFVDKHLSHLKDDIKCLPDYDDIIGQGILLWKIFYSYVATLQSKHNNWNFIRHSDFAKDPHKNYKILFKKLNIPFTDEVNIKIDDLCSDSNLVELPLNAKDNHKRNSQKLIYKWHDILTNDEIKRIRNEVLSISEIWYSNSDWLPPQAQAGDSI
tara:strand:- start:2549 stop:3535 length:987 start_codon:yes stop_codon:yes gene_type:complete